MFARALNGVRFEIDFSSDFFGVFRTQNNLSLVNLAYKYTRAAARPQKRRSAPVWPIFAPSPSKTWEMRQHEQSPKMAKNAENRKRPLILDFSVE